MPMNLRCHKHLVSPHERAVRSGNTGAVVWLTGLSGSGKSTIAMAAERELFHSGHFVYVLDGDNIRSGLNRDLGFTATDRTENIRRVAEVAALFADANAIVLTAFISPRAADRAAAREIAGSTFHEVHVRANLTTCEARDPKGLYARARARQISQFTGVSAPYDAPLRPDLVLDTTTTTPKTSVAQLVTYILSVTALPALAAAPGNV